MPMREITAATAATIAPHQLPERVSWGQRVWVRIGSKSQKMWVEDGECELGLVGVGGG